MTEALWGILLGGALTLIGQFFAEIKRASITREGLDKERKATTRSTRIAALESCREAALTLRKTLAEYEAALLPSAVLEQRFRDDRSKFQSLAYSIEPGEATQALGNWYNIGLKWANGLQTAQEEEEAWVLGTKLLGAQLNAEF